MAELNTYNQNGIACKFGNMFWFTDKVFAINNDNEIEKKQALFKSNTFFQPQSCLNLSWIEPRMLLRCCLIHITFIYWDKFYI